MPTPEQRAYAAALRDIARRFGSLEADTTQRALVLLREMRDRLQLQLTTAEKVQAWQLERQLEGVNALVAQYEAQLAALTRGGLTQSAYLGAASVVEPIQAAGYAAGFFQPTPAQLNVLLDYSADLIRGIGADVRKAINTEIRMAALGERGTIETMRAITQRLGANAGKDVVTGVAYNAERILRTEMGRAFSLATYSQQAVTAQTVPGLMKMWAATGDRRTRLSHLLAHGQVVPVSQPFILGAGTPAMFPGDPGLPASETINCRCRMVTIHPEIGPIGGPLDKKIAKELEERK